MTSPSTLPPSCSPALVSFSVSILLWRIRRRHGISSGPGLWLIIVVALGFCSVVPAALRRANFYEVAICSAYAFTMLLFLGLQEALATRRWRTWWLAAASLGYGLAVGARPNLAFGGALLPAAAWWIWWPERRQPGAWRSLWRLLLPAVGPAALCVAGLLAYNYERFGDIFEFGRHYQLAVKGAGAQFSAAYLWHNLRLYYFTLPEFSRYFPFFSPGLEPTQPSGYFGWEFLHGQFYFVPLLLLALVGAAAIRWPPAARALWPLGAALAFWFLCNGVIVGLGGMRANRYMIDFQPALLLLVGLAVLLVDDRGPAVAALVHDRRWRVAALRQFLQRHDQSADRRVFPAKQSPGF